MKWTSSHGAHDRSRQLIRDSRALLTEVQTVLDDARYMLARQRYRKIVCAWCQRTIRWECCAPDAWGQSSHTFGLHCGGWVVDCTSRQGYNVSVVIVPCER